MDNRDIENKLKESAEQITVKDFSERWNNIKDNITSAEEREILVESPVFATNEETITRNSDAKKRNSLIIVFSSPFLSLRWRLFCRLRCVIKNLRISVRAT